MELFRLIKRNKAVGEITARVLLENAADFMMIKSPRSGKARTARLDAIVDTGAVELLLPSEIVSRLGLKTLGWTMVRLADERTASLRRAGSLIITVCGRRMATDCLVGPPGCEPLLGQIIMEGLDIILDPRRRTLAPRPESPDRPTLKMKRAVSEFGVDWEDLQTPQPVASLSPSTATPARA